MDSITLKLCQKDQCCTTDTLPGEYPRGQTTNYCDLSVLNDCSTMKLDVDADVNATISTSSKDGWKGDKITIHTALGHKLDCLIPDKCWLDTDQGQHTESTDSLNVVCKKV